MKNLKINNDNIVLTINNDPNRIITFNPNDIGFIEAFYDLIVEYETKLDDFQARAKELDTNKEMSPLGIPVNMKEKLKLIKEVCGYLRNKIDVIFGEGASQKAFGNANTFEMFVDFFNGIRPYIEEVRKAKISTYTANRPSAEEGLQ